jgi:hypothetical protein
VSDRKDEILAAAEQALRERRGRSAPLTNQNSPDRGPLYRYVQGVVLGCVAGLIIGYVLGSAIGPGRDTCKVRASTAHMAVCLDDSIAKAKGLLR